jgi:hypothetical protein
MLGALAGSGPSPGWPHHLLRLAAAPGDTPFAGLAQSLLLPRRPDMPNQDQALDGGCACGALRFRFLPSCVPNSAG